MEKYLTVKQREMLCKKAMIHELKSTGLTHEQAWLKLNEALKEKGWNTVSISYIYKYWNKVQDKQ
ncbi:peptide ABC transporter substrate-binding protein [Paenibacillus sp. MWE-103]|uniref:Peptide ABC transporter substrate-binding protein n=1 Tax=Paenibacillus artemisiicola TaxID=1172618 RepID=A0ABS3WHW7_9BACL|nr:peptide ABC transporter substrate-binding protein [Paenibacillus artemisiicola]